METKNHSIALAIFGFILTSLWLLRESVKIAYKIDIFKVFLDWFSDRPILLPSILTLVLPFLLTCLKETYDLSGHANNIQLLPLFDRLLTIFSTVASLAIGNIILDRYRANKEEFRLASIFTEILKNQLDVVTNVLDQLHILYFTDEDFERLKNQWLVELGDENLYFDIQKTLLNEMKRPYIEFNKAALEFIVNLNRCFRMISETKSITSNSDRYLVRGVLQYTEILGIKCLLIFHHEVVGDKKDDLYKSMLIAAYRDFSSKDEEQLGIRFHYINVCKSQIEFVFSYLNQSELLLLKT